MSYVGRFAPSPTGGLHWGNLLVAFCSWARAYRAGGKCILRIEDIDTPRVLPDSQQEIIDDLTYLGLIFDEGPTQGGPNGSYLQSECLTFYEHAAAQLKEQNRVFACVCSRKELQSIASAPHPGEEGPPYPGICRHKNYELAGEESPVFALIMHRQFQDNVSDQMHPFEAELTQGDAQEPKALPP